MTTDTTTAGPDLGDVPSALETAQAAGLQNPAPASPPGTTPTPEAEKDPEEEKSEDQSNEADKPVSKVEEEVRPQRIQNMSLGTAALNFANLSLASGVEASMRVRHAVKSGGGRLAAERVRQANAAEAAKLTANALRRANMLETRVAKHDEVYRPHADRVRANMERPDLQKRFSDPVKRREAALAEAQVDHPQFAGPLAEARFKRSRAQIEGTAARLADDLKILGGKKLDGKLDPKLAEGLRSLHEKVLSDTDNPFDKAARAATFDGQEDTHWREKMEKFAKEALEAIKAFFQRILALIGLASKPDAKPEAKP